MFSKTTFQELSSKYNEPDWLINERLEAFNLIEKLLLPKMGSNLSIQINTNY